MCFLERLRLPLAYHGICRQTGDEDGEYRYDVLVDDTLKHMDHTQSYQKSGVPKILQTTLFPGTLEKGTKAVVNKLKDVGHAEFLDDDEIKSVYSSRSRVLGKRSHGKLFDDDIVAKLVWASIDDSADAREGISYRPWGDF